MSTADTSGGDLEPGLMTRLGQSGGHGEPIPVASVEDTAIAKPVWPRLLLPRRRLLVIIGRYIFMHNNILSFVISFSFAT